MHRISMILIKTCVKVSELVGTENSLGTFCGSNQIIGENYRQ